MFSKKISQSDNSINVTNLSKGTYILAIYRDNEILYKKFLKK
ncbi:MAG: hypothetical protein COW66_02990 [Flavobacteriaceae bacterium CG18_big_fil_WC_8_21_14_2_50_34_36]|nr:MAG: hypothetical protein COW66_02990 [Flavobacteriaceae bacterium CG18_big_fil_WC_8_21_14_2_50_34_36]PIZ08100.1 MAG: hypothetical protein COY56_05625 [Flavobacteriaceae bacterium CG_4_10_14_0_8_um_filter_34_31]PJC06670.1 MAG: hypothetical protein CO068_10030 [Flavobacteriaceae bacterium CG_4_9_14_0_8_um_filter_34_30]